MGFANVKRFVESEVDLGQYQISSFRKVPVITSTNGIWNDLSMATGNPRPNYYTGTELTSTPFNGNNGIYHGADVLAGQTKHLTEMLLGCGTVTPLPLNLLLCDYIMFYPLIDGDNTDVQEFTNSISLPRYESGAGVRAFMVATNPYVGNTNISITYTNSDGVSGRTSPVLFSNAAGAIGTLITGGGASGTVNRIGPFFPLQSGDSGIRSVEGVRFFAPSGGLYTLVLCKPLFEQHVLEINACTERILLKDKGQVLPEIKNGAYLGPLVYAVGGSLQSINFYGMIKTVWG
jgi:hypothetical protein